MTFQLQPKETAPDGMRRIILVEVEEIIMQLRTQPEGPDLAVHQSRKSFKKLRAALRLVRGVLPEPLYREHNQYFRDQSRRLAPARDSAVLVETLQNLAAAAPMTLPVAGFAAPLAYLTARQQAMAAAIYESGLLAEVAASLESRLEMLSELPVPAAGFAAFGPGLQKVMRRGRRRMAKAYSGPYDPHLFHDWRKRVKYLWHHCEILEPVWPAFLQMWGNALHDLSDLLGEAHDLVVLRETLRAAPQAIMAVDDPLDQLIRRRAAQLEAMAAPLGRRLYAERPSRFRRRFAAYWASWQQDPAQLTAMFAANQAALPPLLSVGQLAARLGCRQEKIRDLLQLGALPGLKVGQQWVLNEAALPADLLQMIAK